jgi:hypothetical protein
MQGVGDDQVNDLNGLVFEKIPEIVKDLGNSIAPGQVFGPGFVDVHDCRDLDRNSPDLAVTAKMESCGKAGANDSNLYGRGHGWIILSG